ncbi:MAG: caspase family protein [Pseudonocardiaceae bacterium]
MSYLPIPELSRAILIGASSFTGLPDLPAVNNNLADLASALTDPATGILLRDRCTTLLSPDSTAMFMTRLRAVARQTEDFLLVYYAGHGVRDQLHEDRLYLAVRETDPDGPDGTAVLFASVRDAIEDSPARAKVLILDCCYSGMAVGAMSTGVIDVHEVAVGGTAVITSSPPNKISLSPPGDRHTAFTGELITLLNRGLRIPGEPLTVLTAYRALQVALAKRQLPHPKLKVTDTSSDIILRRILAPPPPPPAERIDVRTPTRLPGRAPLLTPRPQPLIDWRQSESPAPALTPTHVPAKWLSGHPVLSVPPRCFLPSAVAGCCCGPA